ncbi:aminoglycoside phosphotransferase family protein [Mycoplasmatota bacterium WC44]
MSDYLKIIKEKHNIKELILLEGGYSFDEKYHFYSNSHYTLKIYDISQSDSVKRKLKVMKKFLEMGVRCPEVICYGEVDNKCYSIVTFIEGETGQEIVKYSNDLQYEVGLASGKELKIMHSLEYDESIDIYEFHKSKFERVYNEVKELGIKIEKEQIILDFIHDNLDLLRNRPTKILHGDYHLENSVYNNMGYVGCYDFNRMKVTDPIRDFERSSVFSREFSVPYVKGLFDGYGFNKDNFKILKIYLALGIFNATLWTYKLFPDQIDHDNQLTKMILDDYNDFKLDVPKWYK